MPRLFHKRHTKVGARPGTLVIGDDAIEPRIRVIRYNDAEVNTRDVSTIDEVREQLELPGVVWIDVQGLGNEAIIRQFGELLEIHPLVLEDIVNAPQRPKAETYEKHQIYISRMVQLDETRDLTIEQVFLLFGKNFVITFQEQYGDVLDPVRKRIRSKKAIIRKMGADYLAYAIIDTIIDGYYPVLEVYGEYLETLEGRVVRHATHSMLTRINHAKHNLLLLRRGIWPQRDAINMMIRDDSPFITEDVKIYLRDCYDHCVQVGDVLETYRETVGSLLSIYLSAIGNRTNDVMKVLTVMASIFIPLTFLAGIYGMNFERMPELDQPWAYPALLVVMAIIAAGMLWYFKRLGWIWTKDPHDT